MIARAALVATIILITPAQALAECDDADALLRADELRAKLAREAVRMRSWRVTWTALFAAGAIGQLALGNLVSTDERPTYDVGAVKAALGAISTPFLSARFELPEVIATHSPCDELVALRAVLASAARRQAKGIAWIQHVPIVAVNLAGVLYLGLRHQLWTQSILGAVLGTAVGELKLWTQPRGALGWAGESESWSSRIRITFGPRHVGLSLQF